VLNKKASLAAVVAASTLLLAGCSAGASPTGFATSTTGAAGATAQPTIVLVTHDSFSLGDGTLQKFTDATGIKVDVQTAGDAGQLVNKLVLTKDSPLGDVVFGIDNTFASRASKAGVLEDYVSDDVSDAEAQFLLPADSGGSQLTPIDYGDVCINVDHRWFSSHGVAEPTSLDDLTKPAYKNLLVVEAANSSSPGLAFLLATIGKYGTSGWQDYWRALMANGAKVDASWDDAYYSDFSGPSSDGSRPLVVSYASSPPYEVKAGDTSAPTGALLNTCFRQVEYAGILAGTKYRDQAELLVDFLFSTIAQDQIADNMYVHPANAQATIPADWKKYAAVSPDPYVVSPADIDSHRDEWLTQWAAIATP
jgi:thiamine transport system substrate-binding protein